MENTITYVAMDTHKKQHKIAMNYPCREEVVEFAVNNTVRDIRKMVNKIKKQAPGKIEFCYEAGVCGFTLKRRIEQLDCRCSVIAPSLVPRKPGERVKTDRRDARKLLMMYQAGLLTEVHAPDEHLINKGKMPCKANIAVARELAGFIWFTVTQYQARKNTNDAA